MATKVIKRLGKGGYPNGRDATISDGGYGTGGGFSINHGNYDVYEIQSGGGGGIKVITVSVTPGEILNITVGKGGAGAGVAGNQAGSAGAVSIWY